MSTDVSEVRARTSETSAMIALGMEAARASETSVDIQLISRQYILEDLSFILAWSLGPTVKLFLARGKKEFGPP
jgi:hypothetical protein